MATNQTSIATAIQKMNIGGADKRMLMSMLNGMADDIDQMRTVLNAILAKLDAGGATVGAIGTTNVATLALAKTALNVKKS